MKLYTRSGDEGKTSVIGAVVSKDDVRVEAYGTVDELNSLIGLAISKLDEQLYGDLRANLVEIQHELFDCGADLALAKSPSRTYKVHAEMVTRLEQWIDKYDEECPEIRYFILPGGTEAAAVLHVCRTVCRRAERAIVTLSREQQTNDEVRKYINRLSDFLFVAARVVNSRAGVEDIRYERGGQVFR